MLQRLRQSASYVARQVAAVPVPTGGWNALSPLANMKPEYAVTLVNWFPQAGYVTLRKGFDLHVSVDGPAVTEPVETLMTYQAPDGSASLWAGMDESIWDVTDPGRGIEDASVGPFQNVRFQWVNFATSGGNFLWACNGAEDPIYYDGTNWADTTITGISPEDIVAVCAHRGRLWFALLDSALAAYLPVDSIQGAAVTFDLGGFFTMGGYLLTVDTWSTQDAGAGPDDYLVFISSRGQAAVFSMVDPGDPNGYYNVGVYNVGTPIGRRCTTKVGPDLAIITIDGIQSLRQLVAMDREAAARAAITSLIEPVITEAARVAKDNFGWQFTVYPKGTMAILNVPLVAGGQQQYVMNTQTGAWCRFTGQAAYCWALMDDRLFFGSDGLVLEADVAGGDFGGEPFVADMRTAFSYYGQRGRKKRWTMVQPIINTDLDLNPSIGVDTDFRLSELTDPLPTPATAGSLWDVAIWDEDDWAGNTEIFDQWLSVEALGYAAAIHMKVTVAGQALGQELVTNGDFAAWTGDDPDDFTVTGEGGGNEVTEAAPGAQFISDGTLVSIEQSCMTAGSLYQIEVVVSDVTTGGLQFGTKADYSDAITTTGTHTRDVLATSGDGLLAYVRIAGAAAADFTITRLSVKEILNSSGQRSDSAAVLQINAFNAVMEVGDTI